ncbi:hypothetical protein D3C86_2220410 [compost metagenome]
MAGELDKATTTVTRQRFLLLEILETCTDCGPDADSHAAGHGARCGRCERIARFLGGEEA